MLKKTVAFGETMLRLAPPNHERILQTPYFMATFGGSEANAAVTLASLGAPAAYVTVLPERHPVAEALVTQLRSFGVDPSRIVRGPGRMGVYYMEIGAGQRPYKVVYDREYSSMALAKPGDIDWDKALADAGWFHISGITPALSASAAALSLEAVREARSRGLTVSCDLNYRKGLWKWGKPAADVVRELMAYVDVAVANEEDVQMTLGIPLEEYLRAPRIDVAEYERLTCRVLSEFPTCAGFR